MKILFDTNILVDVTTGRKPFFEDSQACLDHANVHHKALACSQSIATAIYLIELELKKAKRSTSEARGIIAGLSAQLKLVPCLSNELNRAIAGPMVDLEDALLAESAHSAGAKYIVTRNTKHFKESKVPAITPIQYLEEIA